MDVSAWLRYGDVCRAAGQPDEAADAYGRVAELAPESTAPLRRLAELALETGDAAAARGHIETLLVRNAERRPTVEELRLLRDACRALDDDAAVRSLDDQLARRESRGTHRPRSRIRPPRRMQDEADDSPLPLSIAVERGPGGEVPHPPNTHSRPRRTPSSIASSACKDFRPNQVQVIGNVLAGQSTLAIMPTGAGKSLTYQLPAMLLPQATLVVSPLIALMKDQIDGLPEALRGRATAINSSMSHHRGARADARHRGGRLQTRLHRAGTAAAAPLPARPEAGGRLALRRG